MVALDRSEARLKRLRRNFERQVTVYRVQQDEVGQKLQITEEEANTHPQSNLLTGCLGTHADPPIASWHVGTLEPGKIADVVLWNRDPFSVYALADRVYLDGALVFDRMAPPREPASDFLLGHPTGGAR